MGIAMLIWFTLSTNASLITVLHVEKGAQLLNATSVSLAAFTVMFPVTKKVLQNNPKDLI